MRHINTHLFAANKAGYKNLTATVLSTYAFPDLEQQKTGICMPSKMDYFGSYLTNPPLNVFSVCGYGLTHADVTAPW